MAIAKSRLNGVFLVHSKSTLVSADRHVRRDVVPDHAVGKRFDRVATELFPEFSRSQLTAWIRSGALVIDGRPAKPSFRLLGGEDMTLDAEVEQRAGWHLAQSVPFDVVFEDEHVMVVDKPAGVVVHPGAGNPDRTLVNGLLAYRSSLAALPRAGIVHRLDKDTSGLMVVAASDRALTELVQAMSAYKIDRRYMAIVEGVMVSGGDVDLAIGRDPNRRTRQRVRADGRAALTHVGVRERYRAHTSVVAKLETGRTHQVRVHMSAIGHPLVGDKRYGARGLLPKQPSETLVDAIRRFPRQALHSWTLRFVHPLTGELLLFERAPPADIADLIDALRDDGARAV
jgi:23S rRNA pseudouridine1911/1915/1917 synthase